MRRGSGAAALALGLALALSSIRLACADAPPSSDGRDAAAADLQRCKDATNGPDSRAVVDLCSRALTHGRLPPDVAAPLYLNRGTAYLAQREFRNAAADFTEALALRPGTATLYALRGRAETGLGDFAAAVDDLSEAVRIAPDRGEYFDARGDAHVAAGDGAAGLADYVQALRLQPCPMDAFGLDAACDHLRAGMAAYLEGADAAAIAEFTQAWTGFGSADDTRALLWLTLARQRSRQDATTPLNDATAAQDSGAWPYALIRYYQGRLSPAELEAAAAHPDPQRAAEQACDLDFYVAARALLDGRATAAAEGFDTAYAACPPARLERQAAKAARLLAARPISAQMAQQMSACAAVSEAGTDPQSIVEFCAAALENPDMPDAWQFNALIMSGAASHTLGDDASAVAALDRAIALRPGAPDAYRRRGLYRLAAGDADGGLADLDRAIALNPELLEARLNRGWALADRGDWKGATTDFTHAVALDPHNARIYLARGAVAFLAGEDAHAIQNFRLAIESAPRGAPYAVVWLALATRRSHLDDGGALAAGTAALDLTQWPGPVVHFLAGDLSAEDLSTAAADPRQVCEAAFYTGVAFMIDGRAYEARDALTEARTLCPDGSVESAAAAIALKKM